MGRQLTRAGALAVLAALTAFALGACARRDAPKQYQLEGQVLAVDAAKGRLTIKHGDIENFMPAMTMTYDVASPDLLNGREPGELITATLEVDDMSGRLVAITHTGSAPLPEGSNEALMAGGILGPGDPVPDTAFIDQTDRRRSLSEWKDRDTLITFIYTRCPLPDFCPLMDQNFATIQRAVAKDATLRGRVSLISITFDPDHDTPAVLAEHARHLEADPAVWTFLTGDRKTIDRFAARFGVGVLRSGQPDGQITHNLETALVGPDLHLIRVYSGNDWTPRSVLADLRSAVLAASK